MQGSPTMLLLRALCAETKSMKVHDSFHIHFIFISQFIFIFIFISTWYPFWCFHIDPFFLCKLRQVPAHPWAAGVLHRALHGNLRAKLVIPWGHHGSSHVIPWPFTPSERHGFPTENFPWKKLFQNHGDMEKLFQNVSKK